MDPVEWIAAALGLANIALLVRRSVWNFPVGMAMVAMYAFVFAGAKLYGEAGLQVFFFVAQGWGWVLWARAARGDAAEEVPVGTLRPGQRIVWTVVTAALALNLGWIMHRFTDAALPYADAAIAGTSIAAQILLALRRIENWVLWVIVDVASVAVYVSKAMWPTAALYCVFLLMSVIGLREWLAAYRNRA